MKKEFKPLSWLVTYYDCNENKIKYYDVLKYREDDIKKMKKKCNTYEEFAEALKREMMYHYWSKAEWELIIKVNKDFRIILSPWCGCRNPEEVEIDVSDRDDFYWRDFAATYIGERGYNHKAKIDVYDQLFWVWWEFVDYVWNYHHKWQRRKKDELLDTF